MPAHWGGGSYSGYAGAGGGGGSYLAASFTNKLTPTATQTGNGYVSISLLPASPVPEPAAAGLLAAGLAALGLARRRRSG